MAFSNDGLRRLTHGGVTAAGSGNVVSIWHYATNDADTVVEADGYFDSVSEQMSTGDIIMASLDLDGTPELKSYIATVTTGDVAIALQSTT